MALHIWVKAVSEDRKVGVVSKAVVDDVPFRKYMTYFVRRIIDEVLRELEESRIASIRQLEIRVEVT